MLQLVSNKSHNKALKNAHYHSLGLPTAGAFGSPLASR